MNKIKKSLAIVLLSACTTQAPQYPDPFKQVSYYDYNNGLTESDRLNYYYQDEGIQYLPYDVLVSLKRPNKTGFFNELFLERPERLGLYKNIQKMNLPPIGITKSDNPKYLPMAGINCATCHTSILTYNGKGIIIDGASGLFAIDRLIQEMVTSVVLTLVNPIEFNEFYNRFQKNRAKSGEEPDFEVLMKTDSVLRLKEILNKSSYEDLCETDKKLVFQYFNLIDEKLPTTLKSGAYPTENDLSSRLKMYSYLVKRVKFFLSRASYSKSNENVAPTGLGRSNPWGVTKNMIAGELLGKKESEWPKESGGPINTPSIWNFDHSKWIFMGGVTNSMLERNIAQGIALVTDFNWQTFETTISISNLEKVSSFARKAKPPKWPENLFGEIDLEKAIQGKYYFEKLCLNCHKEDNSIETAKFEYNYVSVLTDEEYYKSQVEDFYGKDLFSEVLAPFLLEVKQKAAKKEGIIDLSLYENGRLPSIWRKPKYNQLEAKPLIGVWATPPYLHNGSVSSIKELLLPENKRKTFFTIGSMEYDPVNLGFNYEKLYYSSDINIGCNKCIGNSNKGHEYGVNLSEEEKLQLIEYLKWHDENN